jgi:1-acyl-sn-glycerol-3-phosphate acyltransferase
MIQFFCETYFTLTGWKVKGEIPKEIKQCVLIAAPHTSNYDFPLTIGAFSVMKRRIRYLGKKELFSFPLGIIMRAAGGIAVDRSKKNNLVDYMVSLFSEPEYSDLVLVIPPEGTRSKVEEWKTGFYHVAMKANLPIALGYLDYPKKEAGVLGMFYPTGDLKVDLPKIQAYFSKEMAKYPDLF